MNYNAKKLPEDHAAAYFQCELSMVRLRSTPAEDLALALKRDPNRRDSCLSAVYVVGNEANDLLKIGYADNLKNRFSGLNTGSPVELKILHFVYFVDWIIAKNVESEVHRRLAAFRRRGEWFEVSLEVACEAIAETAVARKFRWWSAAERLKFAEFTHTVDLGMQRKAQLYGQA